MTATTTPTPATRPPAPPAARVALKSPTGGGLLDGAWWPRSRDLSAELPALAAVLGPQWGRITRVAINPMLWPVVPRKVTVRDHVLKVGWFTPELDPHKLLLLSYRSGRWDLLVIPPETDDASAGRLMAAACDPEGSALTATALIAAETARHEDIGVDDRAWSTEESWEDEGGSHASRAATAPPATPTATAPPATPTTTAPHAAPAADAPRAAAATPGR
ncbi:DUF5994 family protein [Streptomyces sp. NPDC088785]|uniref:DUF5994 family protein n=1 Tax=Streptomyces sp. NPDC088785 TaxID=3365897 RepID=UPI00381955CD